MPCALPWTDPTDHSPDTLRITCQSKLGDTSKFTIRNEDRFTLKSYLYRNNRIMWSK